MDSVLVEKRIQWSNDDEEGFNPSPRLQSVQEDDLKRADIKYTGHHWIHKKPTASAMDQVSSIRIATRLHAG